MNINVLLIAFVGAVTVLEVNEAQFSFGGTLDARSRDFFRENFFNFRRFRRPKVRRRNNRRRNNRNRIQNRCTARQRRNGRCDNLVVTPPPSVSRRQTTVKPPPSSPRPVTRRPPTTPRPVTRRPPTTPRPVTRRPRPVTPRPVTRRPQTTPRRPQTTPRRPQTTPRPATQRPTTPRVAPENQSLTALVTRFIRNDVEMIPNLVQMVFHVCVGGCDGCLNLNTPDNKGLQESYPVVKNFCEENVRQLSLADCIVFMASRAVELGMEDSDSIGRISVPFTPGRTSCTNPDNYTKEFRFPHGDKTDSLQFLQQEFGLTRKEAIGLMGAHSLGRCRRENSGFDGPWDFTELTLDNGYYKSLVGTEWVVRRISGTTQWTVERNNNRMMLHADVSLVRDIEFGANGEPTCNKAKDCTRNDAVATQVGLYSRNERDWAEDFIRAFVRMCAKIPDN